MTSRIRIINQPKSPRDSRHIILKKMLNTILRIILGILFSTAGVFHFLTPKYFIRIIPPLLPAPLLLVYISGAAEIFLGALLLFAKQLKLARFGLITLLIAIFPANLYMYLHADLFPNFSETTLLLRLPVQALLIFWVWVVTRTK